MIDPAKLQAVKTIIVHDSCSDGMASAMILHDVLPDAEIKFVQYETEEHKNLPASPGMLFCDFSPHKSRTVDFLEAETIVLDHHKDKKSVVEAFIEKGLGAFGDEVADPGVCGAVLAYREVWKPLIALQHQPGHAARAEGIREGDSIAKFATLAGIRDTWQKNDPRWQEACEQADALQFWPTEKLLATDPGGWPQLLEIGPVVYARNLKFAQKCADNSYRFVAPGGLKVAMFEGLKASSDAAEILGTEVDLVIGFANFLGDDKRPGMIFSTRSKTDFDCSAFARAHGGGGHTKAAGFRYVLDDLSPNPFQLAKEVVYRYMAMKDTWLPLLAKLDEESKGSPQKPDTQLAYTKLVQESGRTDYVPQWGLRLNTYQRDNLVWLLAACGYGPAGAPTSIGDFALANTGDWLGEIAIMLDYHLGVGNPNMTLEQLIEAVKR